MFPRNLVLAIAASAVSSSLIIGAAGPASAVPGPLAGAAPIVQVTESTSSDQALAERIEAFQNTVQPGETRSMVTSDWIAANVC